VLRVLDKEIRSGSAVIYGGVEERAYCKEFAEFLGGGYADAVNSGTNAIYVALRALDLEPGSEVIVPPITDPGGTMPVALMGCIPVPADSMPYSLNTSVEQIRAVITDKTSAILVTHIAGHPVDMDPILALAKERGIPVVEDCAQSHSSTYKGRKVGTLGAISAFSTMFGKQHCTGGQGGLIYTRDSLLFARVRQIADRGKPWGAIDVSSNVVASLNLNQDEISCAIGRVQLAKLPLGTAKRRAFATVVKLGLKDVTGISLVGDPPSSESSYWFLMLLIDPNLIRATSAQLADALYAEGIGGVSGGYPFYPTDQPWHVGSNVFGAAGYPWSLQNRAPISAELPNAHEANRCMLRIEVHENLGPQEGNDLVRAIRKLVIHFAK
jgi:dTDP-4-amino-4,6-dideoxygalactose transaminase